MIYDEKAASAPPQGIKRRGFASMSAERRKQVSAAGGRNAHAGGKAYRFTTEAAKKAVARRVELRAAKAARKVKL